MHADFKGEHLLIDDTGQLTGVLDWSDASIGDASLDIEGLLITVGASEAVLIPAIGVAASTIERSVFLARCHTALRLQTPLIRGEPSGPEALLQGQHELVWS